MITIGPDVDQILLQMPEVDCLIELESMLMLANNSYWAGVSGETNVAAAIAASMLKSFEMSRHLGGVNLVVHFFRVYTKDMTLLVEMNPMGIITEHIANPYTQMLRHQKHKVLGWEK